MLFETSGGLLTGVTFFSLIDGAKAIDRFDTFELDDLVLLLETSEVGDFFVNASVRAKMQSAADTERRVGNSNPSCKVLHVQEIDYKKNNLNTTHMLLNHTA